MEVLCLLRLFWIIGFLSQLYYILCTLLRYSNCSIYLQVHMNGIFHPQKLYFKNTHTHSHPCFFMAAMKSSLGRQDQKEDRKIQLEQATLRSAKLIAVDSRWWRKNQSFSPLWYPENVLWECRKTTWTNGKSFVQLKAPTSTVYIKPSISMARAHQALSWCSLTFPETNTTPRKIMENRGFNDGFLMISCGYRAQQSLVCFQGFNQPAFFVGWGWPKPCP